MLKRRTATFEELDERFFIDRSSPTFLRSRKTGKPAGSLRPDSYGRVSFRIDGKNRHMMLSHVIWILYHKKPIPEDHVIDHRDGDRANYDPDNLRPKTHKGNMLNLGVRSNNRSGYSGVQKTKQGRWSARSFPVKGKRLFLGVFDTPEEASAARDRWIVENGYEMPDNRSRRHFLTIDDELSREKVLGLLRKLTLPFRVIVLTQTQERTDEP